MWFAELEADFRPDAMDKRILVHFKYYPDVASVPDRIPHSKMGQVGRVFLYRYVQYLFR